MEFDLCLSMPRKLPSLSLNPEQQAANSAVVERARNTSAGGAAVSDYLGGGRRPSGERDRQRDWNQSQDRALVADALCRARPGGSLGSRSGARAQADLWPAKIKAIVDATLQTKPAGMTHWSCRQMAQSTGREQVHGQQYLAKPSM